MEGYVQLLGMLKARKQIGEDDKGRCTTETVSCCIVFTDCFYLLRVIFTPFLTRNICCIIHSPILFSLFMSLVYIPYVLIYFCYWLSTIYLFLI